MSDTRFQGWGETLRNQVHERIREERPAGSPTVTEE